MLLISRFLQLDPLFSTHNLLGDLQFHLISFTLLDFANFISTILNIITLPARLSTILFIIILKIEAVFSYLFTKYFALVRYHRNHLNNLNQLKLHLNFPSQSLYYPMILCLNYHSKKGFYINYQHHLIKFILLAFEI